MSFTLVKRVVLVVMALNQIKSNQISVYYNPGLGLFIVQCQILRLDPSYDGSLNTDPLPPKEEAVINLFRV